MFDYTVVRSRRRTLSMQLCRGGAVTVRAPLKLAQREIERFALSHEAWVLKHRERLARELATCPPFTGADGDCLPFLGGELVLATGGKTVRREGDQLLLPEGRDREQALAAFLREEARRLVLQLIGNWAGVIAAPQSVKITSASTRWGSCSGKDRLCFSWRTACLPPSLVEYIVVHELCHIREHNHSPRFWATVARYLPDYEERRAMLRAWQGRIPL